MKTSMKKILALLLALVMVVGLMACGPKDNNNAENPPAQDNAPEKKPDEQQSIIDVNNDVAEEDRYGGVLDLVWSACTDHFDPHTSGWPTYFWAQNVYETPLSRDANGNVCPNVCEFELSDDALTLKLWVREGVIFHDGSAVEIEDVVASLDRAGKRYAKIGKAFNDKIANLEVADGVATYTFTDYNPQTMYYISGDNPWSAIIPKEICEKYPDSFINQIEDAIGTGPYYLDSYESNVCYHMKRFEDYVAVPEGHDSLAAPKKAYMDAINMWINTDSTSLALGVIGGEYDFYFIDTEFLDQAEQMGYKNLNDNQTNMMALYFNTKSDRVVNDINLRKAIAAAVDFQELMEIEYGKGHCDLEANPMPGEAYANDAFTTQDWFGESKMDLAKQYLDASSYNGEVIKIVADNGNLGQCPVLIADKLNQLGIATEILYMDAVSTKEFVANPDNDFDLYPANYAQVYSPVVISGNAKDAFWGNAEKDRLFSEMSKLVPGSDEAMALWHELAVLWAEDCATVNLGRVYFTWTTHPDLNPNMSGSTWRYMWNAYWDNPSEHND